MDEDFSNAVDQGFQNIQHTISGIIGSNLLSSYYILLSMKQASGTTITDEIKLEAFQEVISRWKKIQSFLETPINPEELDEAPEENNQ